MDAGLARDGALYLFTLRLTPVFPFFAINLLMGLTPLPAVTFNLVRQAGRLAGTAVHVNAGIQLAGIDKLSGVVPLSRMVSFAPPGVFPRILRPVRRRLAAAPIPVQRQG